MIRNRTPSHQARQVLAALLRAKRVWQHGYELMGLTGLKSGTLYPVLMRLADRGLVESEWQPPVPPARVPRHAYRLTAAGEALARQIAPAPNSSSSVSGKGVPA